MGLLVNDGRLKRGASPLAGIAFYQGPRKPNQNKPLKRPIMRSLAAPFPRRAAASSNQAVEVTPDKKVVWALCSWAAPGDLGPATTIQILDRPQ